MEFSEARVGFCPVCGLQNHSMHVKALDSHFFTLIEKGKAATLGMVFYGGRLLVGLFTLFSLKS